MYNIKIKSIEGEDIYLQEAEISSYTNIYYIIWVILLMLAASSIYFISSREENINYELIGGLSLLAFLIIGLFHIVCQFGLKWKPAYKIYLNDENIIVEKISKDVDQIAICNAVKRLECVAKTLAKNKYELKQIAEKCK